MTDADTTIREAQASRYSLQERNMSDFTHYNRNMPHWLPPGENLFVTIRLANSLPQILLEKLQAEAELREVQALRNGYAGEDAYARQKRYFGRFDQLLDESANGPTWLKQPAVAAIVEQSLQHFNHKAYHLICYCLMPNHLHLVLTIPEDAPPFMRTMQRMKSYTALHANRYLNRTGQFWQRESHDHIIRDGAEMQRVVAYVLMNPAKAGLVENWQQWPYTYLQELV